MSHRFLNRLLITRSGSSGTMGRFGAHCPAHAPQHPVTPVHDTPKGATR